MRVYLLGRLAACIALLAASAFGSVFWGAGPGGAAGAGGAAGLLSHQPGAPDGGAIGSTRNGRVAIAMPDGRRPVRFLAGALTDEQRAELAEVAPNVEILSAAGREEAVALAGGVEGVDGRFVTPAFVAAAEKLVWVQSPSAGVERFVANEGIAGNDRIVLTNMRAVHGPAIADHAFAMLLTLTRGMDTYRENQAAAKWDRGDLEPRPIALAGRTMLVVGLGGIGTEIAERARGFGMRVIATRRSDAPTPEGVERVGRPDELKGMLGEADVVAICVPLTPETEGLFDAAAFAAMRPGAYLINVARGKVVDTGALVGALESGRLGGACLDVTDPEPLGGDSPLWAMSNVVITPHVAADAEVTDGRWWALLKENIRRFGAGEPLLNVVDKAAGY